MSTQRKKYSAEFKAKAALEAIKGIRPLNEIAGELGIHPVQLGHWKKQALDGLSDVFANGHANGKSEAENEALLGRLYQEIGQLKVELDWLKKKSGRLR
jgi:transposase-like protein